MTTVTNLTADDLNMPALGGLAIPAGQTVDVSEEVADEIDGPADELGVRPGHPLLRVDRGAVAPVPVNDDPAPPAEV